jgi:hypothetical protein
VNRLAFIGSFFSCLLPPSMTGSAPVDDAAASTSSYGSSYKSVGGYGGNTIFFAGIIICNISFTCYIFITLTYMNYL